MTLAPTIDLLRTAPPVYRCANCFRRHDDHRGPALRCPGAGASTYSAIPYASHQQEGPVMTEGAYMLQKIKARCKEDGDCLIWQRSANGRGPVMSVDCAETSVRRLTWELTHGQAVPANRRVSTTCNNKLCVQPDHVVALTTSEISRKNWARKPAAEWYASRVAGAKKRGHKVTDEGIADIRHSGEHHSVLMERYGVSRTYIYAIRRGQYRKDHSNPFAGLGARA